MFSDELFRALLAGCLLVHVVTRGLAHRAAGTTKRSGFLAAREGYLVSAALGLAIAVFVGSLLAWLYEPRLLDFAVVTLSSWVRLSGFGLAGIGLALSAWVHITLGRYFNPTMRLRDDHELIERGPYARVRHPMYTAVALLSLGGTLMVANLVSAVSAVAMLFVLTVVRTPIEERMLVEHFGDAYREYMTRTGRYLPRLRRPSSP